MVTLFEGDALAGLLSVPTDSVDVCLMDPPYCAGGTSEADRTGAKGQGLRSETIGRDGWFVGDNMGTAGLAMLLRSVACECVRIVKETGHILVFCDWRMVVNIAPAIESAGLRFQNLVVWNKPSAGLGTGFRAKHELILHLTRGRPQFYRNNAGNVIDGSRINARTRKHPTEKPVELLKELLSVVCPPGGTILDPFAGYGSTAEAAKELGFRSILMERNPPYIDVIRQRTAEVKHYTTDAINSTHARLMRELLEE